MLEGVLLGAPVTQPNDFERSRTAAPRRSRSSRRRSGGRSGPPTGSWDRDSEQTRLRRRLPLSVARGGSVRGFARSIQTKQPDGRGAVGRAAWGGGADRVSASNSGSNGCRDLMSSRTDLCALPPRSGLFVHDAHVSAQRIDRGRRRACQRRTSRGVPLCPSTLPRGVEGLPSHHHSSITGARPFPFPEPLRAMFHACSAASACVLRPCVR